MTFRFGRTGKRRYAAIVSGIPAYTAPPPPGLTAPVTTKSMRKPVSLKATNHLVGPRDYELTEPRPIHPQEPCGEDDEPKQRRRRRRK